MRLDPHNSRLYFEPAGARSALSRHEEAIRDYDRAIRLEPGVPSAYLGRCHAKSERGLHDEAIEDYERVIDLDSDNAEASGKE
ncbi:MAG: tetratricopeptide repeat protein [Acidobacteriia bacterium]|nr:tetratricopeptide repeat protein [Terriglobia bacterium]MYC68948.1 tetratricopeptide repeat protein [Terriglobia bacterium]